MKRWIPLVALVALVQGCATQLVFNSESGSRDPDTGQSAAVLQFQSSSIEPADGDSALKADALRPGDILLTAAPTFRSSAIRMMTVAPVSHAAVYIGDGEVLEAVRPEVRIRKIRELLAEENVVLVLRHPDLTPAQAQSMRDYGLTQAGTSFNILGVAMHAPFGITRKLCELPLIPSAVRDVCIRSIGSVFHIATSEQQKFCSQLVLQAYANAGVPLTDADPRIMSPADILHMREGDVSSVKVNRQLQYVGHLKHQQIAAAPLQH